MPSIFLCFPFLNCSSPRRWIWWLGAFCWGMLGSMDAKPRPVPTLCLQKQSSLCEVSLISFSAAVTVLFTPHQIPKSTTPSDQRPWNMIDSFSCTAALEDFSSRRIQAECVLRHLSNGFNLYFQQNHKNIGLFPIHKTVKEKEGWCPSHFKPLFENTVVYYPYCECAQQTVCLHEQF